jgi:hypothetical protein
MSQSDTEQARRLAQEVVRRDDTTIIEALLADAIGHLADALDELRRNPPPSLDEMVF